MPKKIVLGVNAEITIKEGYEKFIKRQKAMNLSEDTIDYYESGFRYFSDFIGEETKCNEIDDDSIINYISYLKETRPDLKPISINTYLRALRTIVYYWIEKDYTKPFKIHLIKAEKKLKETYTDKEIDRLLTKPDLKICCFSEYRNWVIVNYLLATGNRLSTLANLKIIDIDFDNKEIKLRIVKNKKQYSIPMSSELEKILVEYLEYREGDSEDFVFCDLCGNPLTKEGIKSAIQRYNMKRGVDKTSIHLFRHTFAKNWILNGGDSFRLQQILGHSCQDIVKEYVQMYGQELHRDFDNFNPLDCRKKTERKTETINMPRNYRRHTKLK